MAKKTAEETPLMKQHNAIKSRYPDAVLLFRVGDFYETFKEDAIIASKVLGITLTKRANGAATHIELAGFPHHSLDTYLHKLVKAGHRVAICDQLEDPKTVKGIVKRGVTELVTPGVAVNDKLLDNKNNNFLAALYLDDKENGIAFLDISTGEFFVAQGNVEYMDKLLQSFQPSEVLISKGKQKFFAEWLDQKYYTFHLEDWIFQHHFGYETLLRHFDTQSLKGYGIEEWNAATIAAGAALHYLKETEHPHVQHINSIQRITASEFLWMDRFTIRNLELMHSPVENGYTLLQAMDHTITPMGARMLKRWIIFPLSDKRQIEQRLDWVEAFLKDSEIANEFRKHLKPIGDIERLVAKVPLKKINPREVVQLAKSLQHCGIIKTMHSSVNETNFLEKLTQQINSCEEIQQSIFDTLNEEAPVAINKGGAIKEGINEELDQLRKIAYHGKEYLLKIQQEEIQRTGIPSLKVAFNNVFGYYLEVTNTHKDKVPETWIRKQTLANAERYITEELKEYEEKILGAEEKIAVLELQVYDALIDKIQTALGQMQQNAQAIARIDCLLSFAHIAKQFKYCKPVISDSQILDLKQSRHPVIEQHLPHGETYVHNDILLDKETQQIIILTGPNMSGKSALLRQTALITLMAHVGSYVPATEAVIGLTDKIFTRVGASDNLSGGESTFMVEMNETASIVNNLSARSLILLDEIGRGTSTYDGISIAWSIVEYIQKHVHKPKTLFATHYHELNELETRLDGVKNYHITHKETGNKVIFLRKLAPGGSRHSFGIQVARMAGMPNDLTDRANEILALLEEKHAGNSTTDRIKKMPVQNFQLNIFDGIGDDLRRIQEQLFEVDINTLTPVEALMKLNELKNIVKVYQHV
ncbi:DNA mismatch repair protein MutS [Taibaiella lutea]|uniref:DNA mismatch repair protein MutS n=1 Tax=Taibaiella lutea TaxID=2608001 RepID=A0A5M6CD62_9BACT|nr:DNA mismatch repair protein MutS [Taibaiella lutea]KAA5533118.1 DNA mismatch repair protein MutS [Taibaiella lutea]